jgi:hypothetical protein
VKIYQDILLSIKNREKLLAVLIDPEKISINNIPEFFEKVHQSIATHIFVGGSTDRNNQIEKVNFIVRTSPADDGKRFQPLVKKYPFISWNFPDWNNEDQGHSQAWSQRIPTKKDLINLQSILRYSDLGINMCSTMSIDFMLFDKPVINPVMGTGDGDLANDQKFLKFPHYKTVVESNSVDFAKSPDQLIQLIAKNLSSPLDKKEQRIKLRELQIGQPLENTSERIVDKLENIG